MSHPRRKRIFAGALTLVAGAFVALAKQETSNANSNEQQTLQIAKEVRKQIVTQPLYSVFDDIQFGINGKTVVLLGKASRPTLKSSLENTIKRIEGVEKVDNRIEVLPLSPNDDRIRLGVYRSIYGFGPLQRYTSNRGQRWLGPSVARMAGGITNDPPIGRHAIHIIVENGKVTLTGVVDNDGDLALAEMRANSVPGVFAVYNNLQVAGKP